MLTPIEHIRRELISSKDLVFVSEPLYVIHELTLFFEFLGKRPILKALIHELNENKPNFEEEFKKMQQANRIIWPKTEIQRIKLCLVFLEHCIGSDAPEEHLNIAFNVGHQVKSMTDTSRFFLNQFFVPFFEYLLGKIEYQSVVLYLLQKYKARVEWYKRTTNDIYGRYTKESESRKGEEFLNELLRQYLFDQGIDYPFSEPRSPSGQTDIIAGLDTSDPLVLEVKIFDPAKSYDMGYVKQGFNQIQRYANDYNKSVGYLVIFNVSDKELRLQFDSSTDYPYLESNNKRIYIIIIDMYPNRKSASKQSDICTIDKDYLLK